MKYDYVRFHRLMLSKDSERLVLSGILDEISSRFNDFSMLLDSTVLIYFYFTDGFIFLILSIFILHCNI